MSSISGRRYADGQRLSPSLAALCAPSTLTLNLAAKYPKPAVRAILDRIFGLVGAPAANDAASRDLMLDVPGISPIPARLHEPQGIGPDAPLLVFFHGGGFVLGGLDSHQNTCRFTAKRAHCKVLAVGYRKAPEHRFPAAYEDCRAALRWAIAHAQELGVDSSRIAVGGDSAGGNLAVAATLGLGADEPGPSATWLIYPLVDSDITRYLSADLFAAGPLLTRQNALDMVHHYAPGGADLLDARLSVVRAENLGQLPQTYVATAGMDPIRDQGEQFAQQLQEAGVDVELERLTDMPHGFDLLLIDPGARTATERTVAALARMLGTA